MFKCGCVLNKYLLGIYKSFGRYVKTCKKLASITILILAHLSYRENMFSKQVASRIFDVIKQGEKAGYGFFSTSSPFYEKLSYKLAIIGGGSGGITMAARLRSKIGSENIVVIEPSDVHYYQPYFTLVGAGIKDLKTSHRSLADIMPRNVKWIKDNVTAIDAPNQVLKTKNGSKIKYDFLIIAMGLKLAFEKIKGLPAAFETPGVCSNYSVETVEKTYNALKQFNSGNAIFTQPVNPIKCAGAPQKIVYLADDYFKKNNKRKQANIQFFTALGTIFSAPKYAKVLVDIAEQKAVSVHYNHSLVEIKPNSKEAIFEVLGQPAASKTFVTKYDMIHVTPPMVAPELLKESSLSDASGFLDVNKLTLQHKKYSNIFGIGDCTNVPTSKTAAAVAAQSGILTKNVLAAMSGKPLSAQYNGYTSCPLVTGNHKGVLAEFDFDLQPMETLPWNQAQELYIHYILKAEAMPFLYWNLMLKGNWNGPELFRKIFHFGRTN